jgi:hypothetical protein
MKSKTICPRPSASSNPAAPPKRTTAIPERFHLLVDCRDEAEQRAIYEELARRGVKCRVWVV